MGLETDEYSKISKGDDPSEIFDIHEYKDGDKISRIHWKLSAKQDKTMVKDYSLPIANSIVLMINLDIDKKSENYLGQYDAIIEAVTTISNYLTVNETPHKAVWYDTASSQLKTINVTNEETHNLLVSMLLQASVYEDKDLSLLKYINESEHFKCGHLMYFSTDYKENLSALMSESDLAYRYSYMTVTKGEIQDTDIYDEFAQVIPIIPGKISESVQDMCF
jgi:hypothetical protein